MSSFIPIGITNVKINSNINYDATGLGELYIYNQKNTRSLVDFALTNNNGDAATGKLYTVELKNHTKVQSEQRNSDGTTRTVTQNQTDTVFSGFCYSLDINNPANCAVRIDTDETFVSRLTESTIESMTNNKALFKFNSAELDKMFDCKVYPKGRCLNKVLSNQSQKAARDISVKTAGGVVDNVLSGSKVGNTLNTVGVGKAIKNQLNTISINDITKMFSSPEKMEEAHLEARRLITPVTEEFLLYVRHKYGPYTIVINNGINIQLSRNQTAMNKINTGQSVFKFAKNYMAGFLSPSVLSNNDLKCSTLTRMYDVFMLEWLLNKYFKSLTNVDEFSIKEDAENRLYQEDHMFFEESLELNKRSNNNIDSEADVKEAFMECGSWKGGE